MRSRTGSLPCSRCRSTYFAPPPSRAAARRSRSSATSASSGRDCARKSCGSTGRSCVSMRSIREDGRRLPAAAVGLETAAGSARRRACGTHSPRRSARRRSWRRRAGQRDVRDGAGRRHRCGGLGSVRHEPHYRSRGSARMTSWPESAVARAMVATQIGARGIRDARVLEAMRAVPRELFVPPQLAGAAYDDRALPIGSGQTISQPYMVAVMTEALRLLPGRRVLEVGHRIGIPGRHAERISRARSSRSSGIPRSRARRRTLAALGYANVGSSSATGRWAPGRAPSTRSSSPPGRRTCPNR